MEEKVIFKIENTDKYSKIERIDEHKDGNLIHSTILIDNGSFNIQFQRNKLAKASNELNIDGEVQLLKKPKYDW